MKKNIGNMAPVFSRVTRLAPRRERLPKIRSGTSGRCEPVSIATNASSRTSAAAASTRGLGRSEAGVVGIDQGIDQQRQAGGDRDRTGWVEPTGARRITGLG